MPSVYMVILCIPLCVAKIQMGEIEENTIGYDILYMTSTQLKTLTGIGLQSCGRECFYHKSCSAINFYPEILRCVLFTSAWATSTIENCFYSMIGTWTMVIYTQCYMSIYHAVSTRHIKPKGAGLKR